MGPPSLMMPLLPHDKDLVGNILAERCELRGKSLFVKDKKYRQKTRPE